MASPGMSAAGWSAHAAGKVSVRRSLSTGRRIAAKRFTFIVRADFLADAEAIKKDWSGFDKDNEQFQRAARVVYDKVREYLLSVSEEDRKATLTKAREQNPGKRSRRWGRCSERSGPSSSAKRRRSVPQSRRATS